MALTVTDWSVGRPKNSVEIQETAVAPNAARVVMVVGVLTSDPWHPATPTKTPSPSATGLIFISSPPPLNRPLSHLFLRSRTSLQCRYGGWRPSADRPPRLFCGDPLSAG